MAGPVNDSIMPRADKDKDKQLMSMMDELREARGPSLVSYTFVLPGGVWIEEKCKERKNKTEVI